MALEIDLSKQVGNQALLSNGLPSLGADLWEDLARRAVVGVFRVTTQGHFLWVNRKMAQIFGYRSEDDFLSSVTNAEDLWVRPEDRRIMMAEMNVHGSVSSVEAQAKRADGGTIWICISARTVEGSSGFVNEGFIQDITDSKKAEAALYESERRFRTLIEQAGDGFFVHDYEGRIYDVNQEACRSLGYRREDLLKMNIADIDVEVSESRHRYRFWEQLTSGGYITFEGTQRHKDGRTFPVEVRLSRLDFADQNLLLSLTRDVTERKRAENRLREAFEEINELKNQLDQENTFLREEIKARYRHEEIVGETRAIQSVLAMAKRVATGDTSVLILGETGTGKELLARAIHNMSPRKARSIIKVNCAALPATLIETELFGHEKGAFTGAAAKRIGRFEAANHSTLFLDEIGDLPLDLQAKLLRVLEDHSFERLGSTRTISVNVRVIAATNVNLGAQVKSRSFRSDLFYRLNVFPITMPPLRDRREDIPPLVRSFVQEFSQSMGKSIRHIPSGTMELLTAQDWPGNVRQLRNVIERGMILTDGDTLTPNLFESENDAQTNEQLLDEIVRNHILQTLKKSQGRVSGPQGAAKLLGLKVSTLRSKMRKLNIIKNDSPSASWRKRVTRSSDSGS